MSKPLKSLASIHYGDSPAEVFNTDGDYPIIGTGGEYGRSSRAMYSRGIVVPRKGSLGNPQLLVEPFWPIDTTFAVIAKPGYDQAWVFYHLLYFDLTRLNEATGVPSISRDRLEKIEFPAIGLPTQQKIARILRAVDRAMEKTEALIEKYQQIKAGLMHDLFTRGLWTQEELDRGDHQGTPAQATAKPGQLRPPRQDAPDLYQETPIGWIPKAWQYELLDKLADRGSGHTPSKSHSDYWNGGIKWISLADSHRLDKLYIDDTDYNISALGIQNSSAVLHPPGIVVLSRDAGIGKSAITTRSMAVSQHFMCWKCDQRMDNLFLYYWLQNNKRLFENIAMGSTILTIGLSYFKRLKIACPRKGIEQTDIANRLRAADEKLFTLETDLQKKRAQKSGLMHDLLTGEVPVTPDPEEASDV